MLISFISCMMFFLLIGLASARQRKNNQRDYYLASHSVSPWLVGLSAVATNNSGYMFIGVIGYTYAVGVSAGVLMLGWILGDFLASLFVHKKLRAVALEHNESSYVGALSRWAGFAGTDSPNHFRIVAALFSLIFLLAYASAQLVAGSKALHVLLDWPDWMGAVLGAFLVMCYCIAGGIRASIWTDAAQSVVMIIAMAIMLVSAIVALGGVSAVYESMNNIDGFLSLAPASVVLPGYAGVLVFFAGWLLAGFSVIAQPHIMVRFMALSSAQGLVQARLWYYLWFLIFYVMATAVGMLARIYLPETQTFDAELALPTMAVELLPSLLVGLVLAGIFAATISTADSLLLSCSALLSQDLLPRWFAPHYGMKIATLLATLAALAWALLNKQSVFALVVLSWAMLSACFVPLIILLLWRQQLSQWLALSLMALGVVAVLSWHWYGKLLIDNAADLYQGVPALLLVLFVFALIKWSRAEQKLKSDTESV
jgi:sodium/proline symporter